MRRTAVRLASCAFAATALVLVTAPAASADPEHEPGRSVPGVSSAPLNAPPLTLPHGRKLG
jgi:hypothetical protein